jgi:hypothetical protein
MATVTRRAVEQRVRRHYAKQGYQFHKSRSLNEYQACGPYFLTDNGNVCGPLGMCDLETHAKDLGLLAVNEVMVEGDEPEPQT